MSKQITMVAVDQWVAEITRLHPKYGFGREFLKPVREERESDGKWMLRFDLREGGIYEYRNTDTGEAGLCAVIEGELVAVTRQRVKAHFQGKFDLFAPPAPQGIPTRQPVKSVAAGKPGVSVDAEAEQIVGDDGSDRTELT